ncbi:class I SAM-dependent methyltransferase [Dyadobacter arcticus]|uniref:2-polyprenyl-3-methyl-5-hydroxy-6-metoxy-1, 4-benzoquinol methylase n=1 Tax=Dyadobacter arcticus TaxID=1078754 RepID=A0ABX0UL26_9BACT|nr:class I SAM-dependent methyltransferase [Dyadobacter arcticus]NIJ52320.1 2-polyprenyl-3-methyl-5-hydroxy-6-metoxy-1,4-benzoquinol methylase [Dyadobacter arcticus]
MEHFHQFQESEKAGYEICILCGTYHSKDPLSAEHLYENNYWSHKNGRSTIDEQIINLTSYSENNTISKIDKVLGLVNNKGNILEIGCAPGILMGQLRDRGHKMIGIEPDKMYNEDIKRISENAGIVMNGYFPECMESFQDNYFDHIIAMDVFEHIEDHSSFLSTCKRLLKYGGKLILMSPIIMSDGLFRERDFIAPEHIWIFTQRFLENILPDYFSRIQFDRWIVGHEIIICNKL